MQKIEDCPVCEQRLEDAEVALVCHECEILINPETGEIKRMKSKKAIVPNIFGKLKNFLWSL